MAISICSAPILRTPRRTSTFAFRREGNQIKGFSITLYAVEGGNLSTLPLTPKDF